MTQAPLPRSVRIHPRVLPIYIIIVAPARILHLFSRLQCPTVVCLALCRDLAPEVVLEVCDQLDLLHFVGAILKLRELLAHLGEVVLGVLEVGDLGLNPQDLHLDGLLLGFDVGLEFNHSSPGTQRCIVL